MNIMSLCKTLQMSRCCELDGVHNIDEATKTKLLGVNKHCHFVFHTDTVSQTANGNCVLKWAGINTSCGVVLYQSQIGICSVIEK